MRATFVICLARASAASGTPRASTDAPAGIARWPSASATSDGTSSAIEKVATASIQK